MNYLASFEISAAGMNFEKLRADVATANIANAHTTRSAQGGPYRPMRAVASTTFDPASFEGQLSAAMQAGALRSAQVQQVLTPPRMVYEPGHPDANKDGFVAYPSINPVAEMVSLMSATRAYQANVSALNATKAMALKALEIGGNK